MSQLSYELLVAVQAPQLSPQKSAEKLLAPSATAINITIFRSQESKFSLKKKGEIFFDKRPLLP